jgi:serine/threonine-protein kinase
MVARLMRGDCSESRLRSFLDDRLPDSETARLAEHLDHCEECRQTLERLVAGSRICAELRGSAPGPVPLLTGGATPTEPIGPHLRGAPEADVPIALEFLKLPPQAGTLGRLGPYEVTEVLGSGGFGIVLKAFEPALGRSVAIKVLAPHLATSAAARSRFAREAKAAAAVVHENVVAIHAVDSWNGHPYLVMHFVAGRSLQERVDRDGPLAVKEVLRVGMQAALGLAAAHDQGLVHRDIKPSNILLENGVERAKLSDFGLARAVDDASQTQSGVIAGTPQYMSPEQARGEAVDHRSDLFSLGGVLYFMCTGHPPFRADSTPAVLRRVCEDCPRPLRDINPDVPDWLAEVVDLLLAKDAGGRFATAAEVADVLRHHLAELQRTGTSKPLRTNAPTPVQKRANTKAVAAVLMTSVVVLGLATTGAPRRLRTLLSSLGDGAAQAVNPAERDGGGRAGGGTHSSNSIVGSGRPATRALGLADFESLDVMHPFLVDVTRADRFGVTVTADDNVLEYVSAVKEGPILKITLAEGKNYRIKAGSLKVAVGLPALAGIGLSHGARATVRGFKSDRSFRARVAHGGTLEGDLEAGDVAVEATHGSTIHLRGKARDGRLMAHHGSRLMLTGLVLRAAEIDAEHGSTCRFHAGAGEGAKIRAAHGSHVDGSVEAGDVAVEATHGAKVALRGRAGRAALLAGHGSRLALAGLALDAARAAMDHSSSATVNARDTLDYTVENGSHLKYVGKPRVGLARSARSSSARSITADQAEAEARAPLEEPSEPAPPPRGDLFISTVTGMHQVGGPAIVGSGQTASKVWEIADFDAVTVGSAFHAEITRGDAFKVTTSSDSNLLEHLSVVKEGRTLRIGLVRGSNVHPKEPLRAEVVLPALVGLDAGGASRVTLKGFRSDRGFRLRLHGASKVEGSIHVGDADFEVSGASHLTLTGSARGSRLSASDASHLNLDEFPLTQCEVRLSGASRARLSARSGGPFKAMSAGASTLEGSVDAGEITLNLAGASVANLRGKAGSAALQAAGSSHLELAGLAVGEANVVLSDSSRAAVDARTSLRYVLSPGSRLEYWGDPPVLNGLKPKGATLQRRP